MLSLFNQPEFDNLSSAACYAFSFQTMADGKFVKQDVQAAHDAFENFEMDTNNVTLANHFLEAAKTCKQNKRTGFANVINKLQLHIKTLSATAQVSKTPKI